MYCVCWCDLDPIQGQGQGHGPFELPTIAHNCKFLGLSSATFAWSSKLTVDIDSMGSGLQLLGRHFSNFILGKVSLEFKLHRMSIFHDIQMTTYFGTAWCYSHMVGYAGTHTHTVTWSKVKVKVTGLLNFRQLAKPCMLAAMTAAPLRGFLLLPQ